MIKRFLKGSAVLVALIVIFFLWFTIPALRLYQNDALLGWKGRPHKKGWMHIPALARFQIQSFYVENNNLGFRDEDVALKKTKPRVLILGDSMLWGLGVNNEDMASEILEHNFFHGKVEVINMAMNAYSTDQEALVYENIGGKYKPDVVTLFFYANDISGNMSAFFYKDKKPRFVWDKGKLIFFRTGQNMKEIPVSAGAKLDYRKDIDFAGFLKKYPEEIQYGMALTQHIILKLRDEVTASGAKFILVYAPHFTQIYNNEWTHTLLRMHVKESDMDRFKLENTLRIFFSQNHVAFADMTPLFQKQSRQDYDFYNRFHGHWNKKGNALAAKIIYDALVPRFLTP